MKKLSLPLIVCAAMIFSSCDLFDKIDDVSFDAKLNQSITVDETATSANVTYSQSKVIDATSNADIARYQNKIKGYTINKITYTISDYSSSSPNTVTFKDGKLSFSASSSSSSSVLSSIGSLDLKTLSTSGTENTLNIDQAGLNTIASVLLDNSEVTLTAAGTLSSTPVKFTVNATVYVTVKANAL